ncbi:YqaA family protein [Salinimonas lutimaris]|uniref:YqaA family protein n=1 Tax=Salinimonas lutimaris TaxID=914153 RepID=UPI002FC3016D
MFVELGWAGMFSSALLAATLLPLGSEAVMLALLAAGYAPLPLVLTATAGNVGGSLLNYWLGRYAGRAGVQKWLKVSDTTYLSAQHHFQKYGIWSLCFAWLPVVGDPLTFIAGILRTSLPVFLLLVTLGKGGRYALLAWFSAV